MEWFVNCWYQWRWFLFLFVCFFREHYDSYGCGQSCWFLSWALPAWELSFIRRSERSLWKETKHPQLNKPVQFMDLKFCTTMKNSRMTQILHKHLVHVPTTTPHLTFLQLWWESLPCVGCSSGSCSSVRSIYPFLYTVYALALSVSTSQTHLQATLGFFRHMRTDICCRKASSQWNAIYRHNSSILVLQRASPFWTVKLPLYAKCMYVFCFAKTPHP